MCRKTLHVLEMASWAAGLENRTKFMVLALGKLKLVTTQEVDTEWRLVRTGEASGKCLEPLLWLVLPTNRSSFYDWSGSEGQWYYWLPLLGLWQALSDAWFNPLICKRDLCPLMIYIPYGRKANPEEWDVWFSFLPLTSENYQLKHKGMADVHFVHCVSTVRAQGFPSGKADSRVSKLLSEHRLWWSEGSFYLCV